MAVDRNQRNQTKQAKRFQNLTINYTELLGKMTINDRISMLRSDGGRQLLSSLSPYQLAEMFPDYYKKHYPDVGKLLKSISDPSFKPLSREEADRQMSEGVAKLVTGARGKPSWVKKIEEETGKTISDPSAKVQLSESKKSLLKEMEKSGIKSDDPRAEFLGKLSDDDLKKAGIIKQTDNQGNTVYRRAEISQAEIEAEMQASAGVTKVISAGKGQPTVVEYADGRIEKRTGDRAWRNNNPGNIEYGDFAKSMGAIGSDGRFAIFPTPEMGRDAKNNLLFETQSYRGVSIEKAMEKYAPRSENDTDAYIKRITDALGLPKNTNLSSLTLDQRKIFLDAIQKMEGRATGETEILREGLGLANVQQLTEEQSAKLMTRIRERQEGFVAKKTEIPELPNGLDPGVVSYYNTLNDAEKQNFYAALIKQSGGTSPEQISDGVKRINEKYQKGSSSSVFVSNSWKPGEPLPKTESDAHKIISETATGTLRYQGSVVDKAVRLLGVNESKDKEAIKDFLRTGGKANTVDPEKTPWCSAFVNASLMQSGIRPTGSLVATSYKNWGEAKEASEVAAGDVLVQSKGRRAGEKGGHVGLSTGKTRMRNGELEIEMLAGNQSNGVTTQWLRAAELDIRRARESDYDSRLLAEIKRGDDTKNTQVALQNAEVNNLPQQPQVQAQVQPQEPQAQASQSNTQVAQTQTESQRVPVYATGGSHSIGSDEIKAMPIDSLKGDNSVVVDKQDNPLFTMNTKEEQAVYNPKTRQVDIQPLNKTNPDTLGEKQTTEKVSDTENTTLKENQPPTVMPQSAMPQSDMRSSDTSLTITDDIFKDPSFKRAIAKTRFVDTGDAALGGHFGMANADLG